MSDFIISPPLAKLIGKAEHLDAERISTLLADWKPALFTMLPRKVMQKLSHGNFTDATIEIGNSLRGRGIENIVLLLRALRICEHKEIAREMEEVLVAGIDNTTHNSPNEVAAMQDCDNVLSAYYHEYAKDDHQSCLKSRYSSSTPSTSAAITQPQLGGCNICLENFFEPVSISCGHVFCKSCLKRSLEIPGQEPVCPTCRGSVQPDDIRLVFADLPLREPREGEPVQDWPPAGPERWGAVAVAPDQVGDLDDLEESW